MKPQRNEAAETGAEWPDHGVEVRIARTVAEYEAAFRIAYIVYQGEGFLPHSPFGVRPTRLHFQKSAVVLLAYSHGLPVGTLSLYRDGPEGLPMEKGWPREVDGLRSTGRRLIEFGTLMMLSRRPSPGSMDCTEMFRVAWLYARAIARADTICAFVRGKHLWFYKRVMDFKPLGPARTYRWNGVRMPDMVPVAMELNGAEELFRRRYDRLGGSPRNLYRRFVLNGRAETERRMRLDLARRHGMDWQALRRRFEPLCANAERSNSDPVVPLCLDAARPQVG
jgi:hypothetical protein